MQIIAGSQHLKKENRLNCYICLDKVDKSLSHNRQKISLRVFYSLQKNVSFRLLVRWTTAF